jgi:hypothetical protein
VETQKAGEKVVTSSKPLQIPEKTAFFQKKLKKV